MRRKWFGADALGATLWQLAVAFLLLWLSRFAFAAYNADICQVGSFGEAVRLAIAGVRFDLSALAYFNALFILMRILPFGFVYSKIYDRIVLWVYGVCNSLLLAVNLGDIPYFRFTGARLRWSNILNITTDSDIWRIVLQYAGSYWWAFGAVALAVAGMLYLATRVRLQKPSGRFGRLWLRIVLALVFAGGTFLAMRGRIGAGVPLAIPDAAFAVTRSPQINVVLNSPFCILRSLNPLKSNTEAELVFFDESTLASVRNSVHAGADSIRRRNIVTIVIESGGSVWLDSIAPRLGAVKHGLMPFLDSIAGQSAVFVHTIACSRSSCGGFTAVSCGFPAFDPFYFMLSPYNKNTLDAPARLLGQKGWDTTFYYGCKHGSFNIDQTAFASGYQRIVDREAYGNDSDYDGMWGIFDYPMAEYLAADLSSRPEPFIASWFTVSAHGPFTLPQGWDTSGYKHKEASPERGLEYTDQALRRFFELAKLQPWYDNTVFIITADHGNRDFKGTDYDTPYIQSHIPFIVYAPDGSVEPRFYADRVFSQHDIAATTLGLAGYDKPFVQVGADAFDSSADSFGIQRISGRYMVVGPRYVVFTSPDAKSIEEVYDICADPTMKTPLESFDSAEAEKLLRQAQAFLQDYTSRLIHDRLHN